MTQGTDSGGGASAVQFATKIDKGVTVTMRGGVKMSLCVYRPDAPGHSPIFVAASPY